jgi:hypothetical protein
MPFKGLYNALQNPYIVQGALNDLPMDALVFKALIFQHRSVALQGNRAIAPHHYDAFHLIRQVDESCFQRDVLTVKEYLKKPFHYAKY